MIQYIKTFYIYVSYSGEKFHRDPKKVMNNCLKGAKVNLFHINLNSLIISSNEQSPQSELSWFFK